MLQVYKYNKRDWVVNFPTKKHWKNPSKLEYIEEALKNFVETYHERGIKMNSLIITTLNAELARIEKCLQERMEEMSNPKKSPVLDKKTPMEVLCHISTKVNILGQQKEYIESVVSSVSGATKVLSIGDLTFHMLSEINSMDSFGVLGYKKQIIVKVLKAVETSQEQYELATEE
jgi:hypothetical protein